ncbi:MAG: Ig-like domain-containing protein [Gemmataceae bacterium]
MDGQVGHVTLAGGTLGGEGTTGAVDGGTAPTPAVGSVSPGDSDPGILHTGPNFWGPNTTFHVELENANLGAGIGYDQLQVAGAIDLGGAKLEGLTGLNVAVHDKFTIITAGSVRNKFDQGDTVFIGGKKYSITYNSDSVVIERIKADVQVTLTSSFNPSAYGQQVTFTASVTPKPDATGQPGPDVTFLLDNTYTVVVALDNGKATLDPAVDIPLVLSVGVHTVKVSYNGDADFNPGEDLIFQQVDKAKTSITIRDPQPPAQPFYGQAVVFNYLVSANRPDTAPGAQPPDGTVTVTVTNYNGPPIVLTVDPTTGRVPPLTLTGLSVGAHDVTATYSGNGNYQSTFLTKTITVVRATPNVVVTAQPPTSAFGESIHFTATVTAVYQNAGLPTGQVEFYDGEITPSKKIGQGPLTPIPGTFSGTFSFDTASLARGSHTIIAHYLGDTNFTLTDGVLPFTVTGATTQTRLVVTPSSPVFGQANVTFTATVTTKLNIGTPTGQVTFVVDGDEQHAQTVDLNVNGVAQAPAGILAAGSHSITARFRMNSNFGPSDDTQPLVVRKTATAVTVSPALNPAAANQPVEYTAVVKALPPGLGVPGNPDDKVTFIIDGVPRGMAQVVDGKAKITLAIGGQGVHSVTASYTGSGNFQPSTSPAVAMSIVPFSSQVTLVRSVPSSVFGQPVTYTAVVRGGPFGGPQNQIPTGTVTFFVNGVARQTIALTPGGGAALALNLAVGTPTVTARYNGSPAYAAGIASVQATVAKANTRTVVTSNHPTAIVGQPVTVTATVTAVAPGGGVPPGLVTFFVDGVAQTPLPLNGKGQVSLNLGALPLGGHQVVAVYNDGAVSYNGSTSATFVQNVIPQPPASRLTAALTAPPAVGSVFGIRVVARDQFGNPVANFSIPATIQLLAVPPGGTLLGPRTAGFVNGVASFNGMGVTRAGRYIVRIFAGGLFTDLIIDAQGRLV